MLEPLDDYDWEEVFKYADPSAVPGSEGISLASFGRDDVAELYGFSNGQNDGDNWVCYGKLSDGRFFWIEAGCNYTGWGCQEQGFSQVARTREDVWRLGLTDEYRARLGTVVNGEAWYGG
jgi:hypothetical protein